MLFYPHGNDLLGKTMPAGFLLRPAGRFWTMSKFVLKYCKSAIILHAMMEYEIPVRYPIKVAAGKVTADFITERWRIDELITKLDELGFPVDIKRIGPVRTTHVLNETQAKILTTALERRYFEIPRGIKLQNLASEIGIGASSMSEILRRIFKKLGLNYELENE